MKLEFEILFVLILEPGDFFKKALRKTFIINRIQTNNNKIYTGKMVATFLLCSKGYLTIFSDWVFLVFFCFNMLICSFSDHKVILVIENFGKHKKIQRMFCNCIIHTYLLVHSSVFLCVHVVPPLAFTGLFWDPWHGVNFVLKHTLRPCVL